MASEKTAFLIEWKAEIEPKGAVVALSRTLDNIDKKVFQNRTFTKSLWNSVALNIGKVIKKKFDTEGPGWKPLSPTYLKWKTSSQGKRVKVGAFGKRAIKFTDIGKLTGTLEKSATKRNKDANIFEVGDVPGWAGGRFKYAIDLNKLHYAKKVDDERPFFFLTGSEAQIIMKKAHVKVWNRMSKLIKQGKISR